MKNLYTCDNCIHNPSQYQDIGSKNGFCLQYGQLLTQASLTSCRLFRRKDLPFYLAEEGHQEHTRIFQAIDGIVYYQTKQPINQLEKEHLLDRYTKPIEDYYKSSEHKYIYIQNLLESENPKDPIHSIKNACLIRRYIQACSPEYDHPRTHKLLKIFVSHLGEAVNLYPEHFRVDITEKEFISLREIYCKDVILLRFYAIEEYGYLLEDENMMSVSDELNAAITASWEDFVLTLQKIAPGVKELVKVKSDPLIIKIAP